MYDEIYKSLFDIVTYFNRPQPDGLLLSAAGVSLDSTLFPLLMIIGARGPLGVVELAGLAGKDYSTVSRQVDRLVSMGLVAAEPAAHDRRVRQMVLSADGQVMTLKIADARRRMMADKLSGWSEEEVRELERVLGRVAKTLN